MHSELEISRRCRACGASIRTRARFCPQCGRDVDGRQPPPQQRPPDQTVEVGWPELEAVDVAPAPPPPRSATVVDQPPPPVSPPIEKTPPEAIAVAPPPVPAPPAVDTRTSAVRAPRETIKERAPVGGVAPHVERVRQASNLVIEEAADDPEVRFLLVAAVLFAAFVVIFVIANLI